MEALCGYYCSVHHEVKIGLITRVCEVNASVMVHCEEQDWAECDIATLFFFSTIVHNYCVPLQSCPFS